MGQLSEATAEDTKYIAGRGYWLGDGGGFGGQVNGAKSVLVGFNVLESLVVETNGFVGRAICETAVSKVG